MHLLFMQVKYASYAMLICILLNMRSLNISSFFELIEYMPSSEQYICYLPELSIFNYSIRMLKKEEKELSF